MDVDDEQRKAIWLMRFGIGLLIATVFAWGELKYAAFGTTVAATAGKTEIVPMRGRNGRDTSYRVVNYTFTDRGGVARAGYDRVPDDFSLPPGRSIAVTYRGDDDVSGTSRLAGTRWGVLAIWLVFFVPTAWFVGGMVRESMQHAKEKRSRPAKRPYRF